MIDHRRRVRHAALASGSITVRSFCLTLFMARSIGRTVNSLIEQQILAERCFLRDIEPSSDLVVGERQRHAIMI
jgi:hypothetical protein